MKAFLSPQTYSNKAKNFLTFFSGGLIFYIIAPLQADPHHDGVILAPAIAFSEGLPLHAGAFSQYGPLSPLVSGFWLKLTENSLLSLRYFAALQALSLSIGLFFVLRKFVSEDRARILTSLWIFASGIWATTFPGALMAWPSLLSSSILIYALLIALNAIKHEAKLIKIQLFFSGFLIAISGFARAQSWIIAASIGVVLLITGKTEIKKVLTLCLGYFVGIMAILGILLVSGTISDWWLQSVYWPTQFYPAIGTGNHYNRFQIVLYFAKSLWLVTLILAAVWIMDKFSKRASITFISLGTIVALLFGFWVPTLAEIPIRIRVILGEPLEHILVSPFYLAALTTVIVVILELRKKRIQMDRQALLASLFGFLSIIQLYPQSDVLHLWWIAPLLLPSLAIFVKKIERNRLEVGQVFYTTIKVFSICGIVLGLSFINREWKEFENDSFSGTYASKAKVDGLKIYNEISKNALTRNSSFDCPDGVYSVFDGKYLAVDQWYVNWGFPKTTKPSLGQVRFICGQDLGYATSEAKRIGWKLVEFSKSTLNPQATLAVLKPDVTEKVGE